MRGCLRYVKLIGPVFGAAALVFVGLALLEHRTALAEWRPGWSLLAALATLALLYGGALFLLAETWHCIVGLFGPEPRSRTWASYTGTQLARYLPGNVAHVLGRAAWLHGGKLRASELAYASAIELIFPLIGACLALAVILPLLPVGELAKLLNLSPGAVWAGAGLAFSVSLLAAHLLLQRSLGRYDLERLLLPLALATTFLLCLGGVFATVAALVAAAPLSPAIAIGIVSWLAGYVTPGAPGGLGPREALILGLLSSETSEADALIAALAFRLVTTSGDVACYVMGIAAQRVLRS